jgi:hypothetical protein
VLHWGQRKLLMSEIAFLMTMRCCPKPSEVVVPPSSPEADGVASVVSTVLSAGDGRLGTGCDRPDCSVVSCTHEHAAGCTRKRNVAWLVYAGAAPGTHIPALAALFPGVHFVLVDPAPFKCG